MYASEHGRDTDTVQYLHNATRLGGTQHKTKHIQSMRLAPLVFLGKLAGRIQPITDLRFGRHIVVTRATQPHRLVQSFVGQCRPELGAIRAENLPARTARHEHEHEHAIHITFRTHRRAQGGGGVEEGVSGGAIETHSDTYKWKKERLVEERIVKKKIVYILNIYKTPRTTESFYGHAPTVVFPTAQPEFRLAAGALRHRMIGHPQHRTGQIRGAITAATPTNAAAVDGVATLFLDRLPGADRCVLSVVEHGVLRFGRSVVSNGRNGKVGQ